MSLKLVFIPQVFEFRDQNGALKRSEHLIVINFLHVSKGGSRTSLGFDRTIPDLVWLQIGLITTSSLALGSQKIEFPTPSHVNWSFPFCLCPEEQTKDRPNQH